MKLFKSIPSTIFTILVFTLIACNGGKKVETETKEEEFPNDIVELRADQVKLANIETASIELHSLSGTLKVNGVIAVAPQDLATVCMPLGGFIKSTSMMAGNVVSKGQILAIIENQEFVNIQQSYLEAKSKLEYAEAEYNRHKELYKDDVYSQKNLQEVTANFKSLKSQVNALEQKLLLIGIKVKNLNENTISSCVSIVSPISGYIKTVNINIGKYVDPTDVLFEIVNTDKLFLELTLFDKDIQKVSIGQKIRFYINNETEQHEAIVYQTGKSMNADKTYKVYATVSGGCKNVMPGMYVNAIIEATNNKVTALPSEAIVTFEDKDYIFVFDKNKEEGGKPFTEYRMIEVHKGVTDGGYTEIILPKNFNIKIAKVVVKGAYNLLSAKKNAGEMSC